MFFVVEGENENILSHSIFKTVDMHSLWKNSVEKFIIRDPIELGFLSTSTYPYC